MRRVPSDDSSIPVATGFIESGEHVNVEPVFREDADQMKAGTGQPSPH